MKDSERNIQEISVMNGAGLDGTIQYEILGKEESKYIRICGVDADVEVLSIPPMIDEMNVEIIRKGAFEGNRKLTQVLIPEGVRLIGSNAFKDCVNLKRIELPHNLEVINAGCFEGCENLREINIPYSVKKICTNAFKGCDFLDKSIVTNKEVEIAKGNFVKVKKAVTFSGEELEGESFVENGIVYSLAFNKDQKPVFVNVKGLDGDMEELHIPERIRNLPVRIIKKGAFAGEQSIEKVYVPESVRLIGSEAFKSCTKLKWIELPAELNVLNASTFEGCVSLETAVLPYELKRIATNVFKGCEKLRETYHYTKTGIGITMTLDKSLREGKLPSGLEYIGKGAFEGCSSITDVYLPIDVSQIANSTFKDCVMLQSVRLHNKIKSIDAEAFLGCSSLKTVRLPNSLTKLDRKAFDDQVKFVCNERLVKRLRTLQEEDKNIELVEPTFLNIDSKMIPGDTSRFYSDEALRNAVDYYESRTPMDGVVDNHNEALKINRRTRYILDGDTYCYNNGKKTAKIMLTGDLMCRFRQMGSAYREGEGYSFEAWYQYVKPILSQGDLVVGNMESMVANSYLYSDKASFIDDRVHLNAPDSFVASIRNAGFDLVVNAQNHAYDTGTQGLFETLDVLNRAQLMHTGLFAGKDEKRYVTLDVNGFRIAIMAYFDQARQPMKRANFTKEGLDCLFNTFKQAQIEADVKSAREEGVEFIIAYSHCGREYTDEVSNRQANFAKMLADAGVDYIFGCHSHCIQPYREITTEDGRIVPVLYSGGNFCSDMSIKMPYVRDTLIGELILSRVDGKVIIERNGYHPCLIKYDRDVRGNIVTVPIASILQTAEGEDLATAEMDLKRIIDTVDGKNYECILDIEHDKEISANLPKEKKSPNVQLVADCRGISYEDAKAEMDRFKKEEDVIYREYVDFKLYECENDEEVQSALRRIRRNNEKRLNEICQDTGWTKDRAKKEVEILRKSRGITYRQFSRGRFYEMTPEEIDAKIKSWNDNSKKYVQKGVEGSGWSAEDVKRHLKRVSAEYDIIPAYYPLYRCWELSDDELRGYARLKDSSKISAKYNKVVDTRKLADKAIFNEIYKDYTGRKYWINRDTTFDEFKEFAHDLNYIFCKPIESGGGQGAEKHEVTDDLQGLYDLLMSKARLLVEECIEQHPDIDAFSPTSCNTIRVVVIQEEDGTCRTICTGIRFGNGGVTDNFSSNGMVADIDPETGIIRTNAVDKKGDVYETHPITGKKFMGFQIPNWDMVRNVTEAAMSVLPGVNYVGWDVAVCKDKVVLVEGNSSPDLVLIQAPYAPEKKGMKYLFKPYLEE